LTDEGPAGTFQNDGNAIFTWMMDAHSNTVTGVEVIGVQTALMTSPGECHILGTGAGGQTRGGEPMGYFGA
jgi:hypothetical protein